MRIKFVILSFLAGFLISGHVNAEDVDSVESLRDVTTTELVHKMHDEIVGELVRSGVSTTDAEHILFVFAEEAVDCLVDVTEQLAVARGIDLDEILRDVGIDGVDAVFRDQAEAKAVMKPCLLAATANAGLSIEW